MIRLTSKNKKIDLRHVWLDTFYTNTIKYARVFEFKRYINLISVYSIDIEDSWTLAELEGKYNLNPSSYENRQRQTKTQLHIFGSVSFSDGDFFTYTTINESIDFVICKYVSIPCCLVIL